jgi:glycerophosphoryl diester phosphodiesterase
VLILGHRGGRGPDWPPENSLEAFSRAFAEGAAGIELDVRLCATGEPVLLHDVTLARITEGADRRPLHRVPRADLPPLPGGARIPHLEDALALALAHERIVNVEIKADAPRRLALVRAVARSLARVGPRGKGRPPAAAGEEIVVSSFDPGVVLAFGAIHPTTRRAILVGPRTPFLATVLPLALRRAISGAHVEDTLLTAHRVARLQQVGLRVVAWTVNDAARAAELAELGVDWTITDCPAELRAGMARSRGA